MIFKKYNLINNKKSLSIKMDMENKDNEILNKFLHFFNNHENEYLKEWVKNFNEPNGFMFSISNEMNAICTSVDPESTLDNATALYLRKCQYLFNSE